jgi:hypothetical protein
MVAKGPLELSRTNFGLGGCQGFFHGQVTTSPSEVASVPKCCGLRVRTAYGVGCLPPRWHTVSTACGSGRGQGGRVWCMCQTTNHTLSAEG